MSRASSFSAGSCKTYIAQLSTAPADQMAGLFQTLGKSQFAKQSGREEFSTLDGLKPFLVALKKHMSDEAIATAAVSALRSLGDGQNGETERVARDAIVASGAPAVILEAFKKHPQSELIVEEGARAIGEWGGRGFWEARKRA